MIKNTADSCPFESSRNVICAFYASTTYGSEYRAGLEFIKFAASNGFDLAIVADLEENSTALELEAEAVGIKVVRVPSLIKRQQTLYRYTDLVAQWIWHFRAAQWMRTNLGPLSCLWVQNGASPWLPLKPYFGLAGTLVWGPVGGGEPPSPAMMKTLSLSQRLREYSRSKLEKAFIDLKLAAINTLKAPRIVAIARTKEAHCQLSSILGRDVPIIPEILDPLTEVTHHRTPSKNPRLLWVGQNIPRKNLALAFQIFQYLREGTFPDATLDVFGCTAPNGEAMNGVTFHGWVSSVPWQEFRNDGILLLTSFREGLPSVVLEAVRNGLLCITADVGAIGSLDIPTIHLLPKDQYPNYSEATLNDAQSRIEEHLAQTEINLPPVSNRKKLTDYLYAEGAIK
jgi:glycosyltransferase involved in cell wall biosynthesis